jgi:hypothetical protein
LAEAGADTRDPFKKEASLHYKTDGKTIKIWSIGRNRKDDDGNPKNLKDISVDYPYTRLILRS